MPRVTITPPDSDAIGEAWLIYVDGVKVRRGFTPETTEAEVKRFAALLEPHADELLKLEAEYADRLQWNMDQKGNGKNWPIFGRMERLLNRIQREAGIVDT